MSTPQGWRTRLVKVTNPNTRGITGLCLDVNDLAISKYVAGREKDSAFTAELARNRMTDRDTLLTRADQIAVPDKIRKVVKARIHRDFDAHPRQR